MRVINPLLHEPEFEEIVINGQKTFNGLSRILVGLLQIFNLKMKKIKTLINKMASIRKTIELPHSLINAVLKMVLDLMRA